MRCPRCSSEESKVIDSRTAPGGAERRRRRECGACGERFTTYERFTAREDAVDALPQVVKRNGERAAFDPERLRSGILKAIGKRPVAGADVEAAIGRLRRRLPSEEGGEVPSARIGEWVMIELRALDPVAYVRFAAGRRRFVDAADLPAIRDRIESGPAPAEGGRQLPLVPRE